MAFGSGLLDRLVKEAAKPPKRVAPPKVKIRPIKPPAPPRPMRTPPIHNPYIAKPSRPKLRRLSPSPGPIRTPIQALHHTQAVLAKHPNPVMREAASRLRHALASEALFKARQPSPEGSGNYPSPALKRLAPRAYAKSRRVQLKAGSSGGATADPIAEAVIATGATAGLGAGAKLAGLAGKAGVEAIGSKLASKEATVGAEAAGHGIKALAGSAGKAIERGASRRLTRIRETPTRVRTAPLRAANRVKAAPRDLRRAATTPEGRRAAARATARSARRHPVRAGYGAAVALPPGVVPGDVTNRARAFAQGSAQAILRHPVETAQTTGRSLSAAITAPAALAEAAGLSAIHGNPKYLENTASAQAKGLGHILGQSFSGSTKKAEEAARKEGSLSLLTPLPALTRLKAYERGRGVLRRSAADVRRNVAARSEKLNRRVRHAPKGIEQPVFGLAARHGERKTTALIKQRTDNPFRMARSAHREKITAHMAKAPKGSDVAFQTAAEFGIRDQRMADLVRAKGPGDPHLIKALDYMDRHPGLWRDPHFKEALKAGDANSKALPASLVGKGERARLMAQGDLFGVTRPENAVPFGARHLTLAPDRQGAYEDLAQLEKTAKGMRRVGHDKLVQARVLKGARQSRKKSEVAVHYRDARKLEAHAKALRNALEYGRPKGARFRGEQKFTKPGVSIDRSAGKPYDSRLLAEHKAKVEAARQAAGAAPAIWTHHAEAPGHGSGFENPFPTPAGRVEHMRTGQLAKEGKLDRSFESYVKGTIDLPRQRESGRRFMRNLVEHYKTPFTIDGKSKMVGQGSKDWNAITSRRDAAHPNGGQIDPSSWGRLAYREWKNALKDPYMSEAEKQGKLDALLRDAEAGKVKGSEPWVLVPREAIKEARLQITPEHSAIVQALNAGSRIANRSILATNPAWEVAQTVAEGIPIILAHPEALLKAPQVLRDIHRYHKSNPEGAIALEATAGAAPISSAALRTPLDMQETYTPALWEEGAKELTRGKSAKEALSFAKLRTLGRIDAKRQNVYRTTLYALEADKRFRSFHSGLTGLFDKQRQLSGKFKTREELWNWLEGTKEGRVQKAKLEDYVDNIAGNWTAFSHFERTYAPLAIFYGFLRYSLRWTLWTFPKTHPVTATIAYMLGQQNSNQIEKIIGGKPSNPLEYAYPVYSTPSGKKAVLPAGSRISPGQSPLTQVLATGNPGQVVSSANPLVAAGYTAFSGQEPLSGEKSTLPAGYAAIKQLLAMPAPVRVNAPDGTPLIGGTSISQKILEALGAPSQSAASKAYEKFDKNRGLRSLLLPPLPQSAAALHGSEHLSKEFAKKYGQGHVPGPFDSAMVQDLLYGGPGGTPQPKKLKAVLKAIHGSEAASAFVKKAEQPTYGKGKPFTATQKALLKAVEEAWTTGPGAAAASGSSNPYMKSTSASSGNPYMKSTGSSSGNPYMGG
jgi:hypothetical protein